MRLQKIIILILKKQIMNPKKLKEIVFQMLIITKIFIKLITKLTKKNYSKKLKNQKISK